MFAGLLNKLYKMTLYAFFGASLLDPRFSVSYIGRYTKRAVLAEYRITYYDGKMVQKLLSRFQHIFIYSKNNLLISSSERSGKRF